MDAGFWEARWRDNRIGFHKPEINTFLQAHWSQLEVPAGATVLVPLCGKSLDMLWLAERGHRVMGVEVSRLAVEAFFTDNNLPCTRREQGSFSIYESGRLQLWCGDFFALQATHTAEVTAVYDRASLIALPQTMRQDYVTHLDTLLPGPQRTLLITLDYAQREMPGPPFAVAASEVAALYEPRWTVTRVAARDALAEEQRFRERGLTRLSEEAYILDRAS